MKLFIMFFTLALTIAAVSVLAYIFMDSRCQKKCNLAVAAADNHAAEYNYRKALEVLDEADNDCRCSRFTQGDEPPEYASARLYLAKFYQNSSPAERIEFEKHIRGSILNELISKENSTIPENIPGNK
ncbi:MAG: hypothetical protein OEZ39_15765 [Gammaproteobacteria bacterium]|nr:hypothetical protein [Gammaproteobacteria bacterium]MDH5653314.1 hypothetical protein [Gammaproteobacteria bacterium]